MGGFSLERLSKSLDIEMTPAKSISKDKSEYRYQGNWLPKNIYIKKGKVKLILKVKGPVDGYFKKTPHPQIPYLVYKNGKQVESFVGESFVIPCINKKPLKIVILAV